MKPLLTSPFNIYYLAWVKFWSEEAYKIAKIITNRSDLSTDLVAHVYIILQKYEIPEEDLPKAFVRYAHNQWKWYHSDFNKLFRSSANTVELSQLIKEDNEQLLIDPFSEEIIGEKEKFLNEYLDQSPTDDTDNFCREITKMYLYGMTYREIKSVTGISLDVIHKAIKQIKHDINDNYERRDSKSHANVQPSGYEAV